MLLSLALADGVAGGGKVQVVVDYGAVAKAYGGGYGSRLHLLQMPACALTSPQLARCRTQTAVPFTNRASAHQLTATITLPAGTTTQAHSALAPAALTPATSLAVSSGSAGSQGDYSATPLNPSGTWQVSGTGAYTYSYPIDVPAAPGGNAPSVALAYNSQDVDGETSARNSQASWIGDGWNYSSGFVEQSYRSCGSLLDSSGSRILKGSGDQYWGGDNATMSFGTHSGVLVPTSVDSSVPNELKAWKLQGDDGTVVQELSGANNGLYQGTYFRVLTTDGAQAYFGADHAPASAGPNAAQQSGTPADASTGAAWGVPVLPWQPRSRAASPAPSPSTSLSAPGPPCSN